MQATPEFVAALEAFNDLAERDLVDTPAGHAAWGRVIHMAPVEFLDAMNAKMRELDLLPAPAGLDANSRPVYKLSDVADKLGIPEDEAIRAAESHSFRAPPSVMREH